MIKTKRVTSKFPQKTKLSLEIENLMNEDKALSQIVADSFKNGFETMESEFMSIVILNKVFKVSLYKYKIMLKYSKYISEKLMGNLNKDFQNASNIVKMGVC